MSKRRRDYAKRYADRAGIRHPESPQGLKDPVNLGSRLWAVRVRGRELCKVAPEQVRGDNAISTVTGSFAATAAQDDATGSV